MKTLLRWTMVAGILVALLVALVFAVLGLAAVSAVLPTLASPFLLAGWLVRRALGEPRASAPVAATA